MNITTEEIETSDSLSGLEELVGLCQRCDLYKTKTKDVFGDGDGEAKVMFIGEAPGKDEDLQGKPFVGRAGQLLSEMIKEIGWERKNVFIANVLKHRPPENRDPLPDEASACWPYLKRQIQLIQPKLIVFLGRHALVRFFPTLQISKVHGKAFRKEFAGRQQAFLALYHPAVAIYNAGMRETLMTEFKRIPKILEKIETLELLPQKEESPKQEKLF